jgi:xanthine dehydrogenase accessory factor
MHGFSRPGGLHIILSSEVKMIYDPDNPELPGHTLTAGEMYLEMKKRIDQGARAAMATILQTRGSTPQRAGAKMVIFDDGTFIGTVGGGCVEADIWAEAQEVLRTGQTGLYHFNLNDDYEDSEGMVCGGQMDVLIERWSQDD